MKKKIIIKQEDFKDIPFSKITNIHYVNVEGKEMEIQIELKDE